MRNIDISTDRVHLKASAVPLVSGAAATPLPILCETAFNTYRNSHCAAVREAGHWRWQGTEELSAEVRRLSLMLYKQGVSAGSCVGLVGDPSPHWLAADLAIMATGALTVPLFPTMSVEHLRHEATSTGMRTIVVLGESAWALVRSEVSRFRLIVTRGVTASGARVRNWHDALAEGDRVSMEDPALYSRLLGRLRADDPATIIHTSGSTGMPKGVVLTHANLSAQIAAARGIFPLEAGKDRALSCLPLAHVFERMVVYTYVVQGVPVLFADDVKHVGVLLREVQPSVMTAVPRLIEKIHLRVRTQIAESVAIKRQLGRWALELAMKYGPTAREKRGTHPFALKVADRIICSKLRQALGGHFKYLIVGGAALSEELTRFLLGVGIPVYAGYGMTEASPVIAVNRPGERRIGSVGKVFPGMTVRISDQGEILARGPGIMRCYHGDPVATAATIDVDGWLHTGDLGRIDDDGYLFITGRMKELYKTANGKYVAPVPIEQALIDGAQADAGGLIDQVLVVAEGQPCVGALLFPDADALRRRKHALGLDQMSDEDFSHRPEISGDLRKIIDAVNGHLDQWQRIRCWRFVPVPPSVERDEMTPTMKLKRHVLTRRWQHEIDDMYATREGAEHA